MKDISEITIAEIKEAIQKFFQEKKYNPDVFWDRSMERAEQMKNNAHICRKATHISKGIHSSSQGDSVYFSKKVNRDYVNTKTITSDCYDVAISNSGNIPLAYFFEWEVIADSGIKMRDVILENGEAVQCCFDDDPERSRTYQQAFLACLEAQQQPRNPQTDERNKQLLWALPQTDENKDNYVVLVPLYPSVLTHEFYHKIKKIKEDSRASRKNRKEKKVPQKRYADLLDLAQIKLGGSNPQNVSLLTGGQRGINYLLPSLPPVFREQQDIDFSKKLGNIFKSKSLYYRVEDDLKILFGIVYCKENNYEIRDTRKATVHRIAHQILSIGETIRALRPAGWSKDYNLSKAQKHWLDPKRADLTGEEKFKAEHDTMDWDKQIEEDFADWLQGILKKRFKTRAHEFKDVEHREWQREMRESFRLNKRGLL